MVIPLSKPCRCAQWLGSLIVALLVLALSPAPVMAATQNMSAYHIALQAPGQGTVRLYAEEHGRGNPVLLLHGLGASTFTWRNLIPALSRHNRVITLDMKGFGRSEKPFTQAYSPYDHANLVLNFIRKRKLRNLTIIGHSYGGAIAMFVTLRLNETSPGRVKKLVLMNAPTYRQPSSAMVSFMKTPVVPYAALMLMPPELTTWLSLDKVQATKLSYDEVRGYAAPYYDAAARHALITTARRIEPQHIDKLTSRYPSVRQPTLILSCEGDQTVPITTAVKLAKVLPNARLKILKGCGHVPQDERPEAVVDLVTSFLGR